MVVSNSINQLGHSTTISNLTTVGMLQDGSGNNIISPLGNQIRFSRNFQPTWIYGAETTAPAAGTSLTTKTVTATKTGHIYGVMITAQEANDFRITWTSATVVYTFRIIFSGSGTMMYTDVTSMFEGLPADAGTVVKITNVNSANVGKIYQAAILYAEV